METPSIDELSEWYKGREIVFKNRFSQFLGGKGKLKKKEGHISKLGFDYSPEGDLMFINKKGDIETILSLPTYRPPTSEEIEQMEIMRLEQIATAQAAVEQAREELRFAITSKTATPSEIVNLNRKVMEADMALQLVRFPLRDVEKIDSIEQNRIIKEDARETRKMKDVGVFISRPFTLEEQYTRIADTVAEPKEEEPATKPKKLEIKIKKPIILFKLPDTNDYGFMSLEWPVRFTYNTTEYPSAKHALYGELAKQFEDDAMFDRIQSIEDPLEINFSYDDYKTATEEAWNMKRGMLIENITREKFMQHPELAERLLLTKNAHLGADIMGDLVLGIGLSIDDPKAQRHSKWTGMNLLGKSLETVRKEIKKGKQVQEDTVETPVPPPVPEILAPPAEVAEAAPTPGPLATIQDTLASTVKDITEAVRDTVAPLATQPPVQESKKRTLRLVRK